MGLQVGGVEFFLGSQANVNIVNTPNVFEDGDPRNADSLVIENSLSSVFNNPLRIGSLRFAGQNAVPEKRVGTASLLGGNCAEQPKSCNPSHSTSRL